MAYAWSVATGQGFGGPDPACSQLPCPRFGVDVPDDVIPEPGCYAFEPTVSAECAGPSAADPYPTYMTRYPPPFYAVTGLAMVAANATGATPGAVGYTGRTAAAVLSLSLLVPAGLMVLRRQAGAFGLLVASLTAMSFFMMSAVNPSGLEISAAIAGGVGAGSLIRGPTAAGRALLAYSIPWLAWARPVGWLWAALILACAIGLAAVFLGDVRSALRSLGWGFSIALVGIVSAFGWFLFALQARSGGGEGLSMPNGQFERYVAIVFRWGGMAWESLGVLGWLDTPLPKVAMILSVALIAIICLGAVRSIESRRAGFVVIAYFVCLVFGVSILMGRQDFLWQGRYVLPSVAAGAILLGFVGDPDEPPSSTAAVMASMLWTVSVLGAIWVFWRYAFGLDIGIRYSVPDFAGGIGWRGPLSFPVILGLALLSVAAMFGAAISVGRSEGSGDAITEDARDAPCI